MTRPFGNRIESYLNVDQFLRTWPSHRHRHLAASGASATSIFLYLNPTDDKFSFIPWDMNLVLPAGSCSAHRRICQPHHLASQRRGNKLIDRCLPSIPTNQSISRHISDLLATIAAPDSSKSKWRLSTLDQGVETARRQRRPATSNIKIPPLRTFPAPRCRHRAQLMALPSIDLDSLRQHLQPASSIRTSGASVRKSHQRPRKSLDTALFALLNAWPIPYGRTYGGPRPHLAYTLFCTYELNHLKKNLRKTEVGQLLRATIPVLRCRPTTFPPSIWHSDQPQRNDARLGLYLHHPILRTLQGLATSASTPTKTRRRMSKPT